MPQIDLIPVPEYNALDPYHVDFDNLPLKALITRMELINSAVDTNSDILRNAIGTQGTLANRLNQSINADGSLIKAAVDNSLHNIGAHTDGTYESVEYVRMLLSEREKLSLIADEATSLVLEFQTPSTITPFSEGSIKFIPSSGVGWNIINPNEVQPYLKFPTSSIHTHYYGITPQYDGSLDFQHYKTGYTVYIPNTLRVTINGVRIYDNVDVYVPGALVSTPWTLNRFTGDPTTGKFVLDTPITLNDVIRVDFDVSLT